MHIEKLNNFILPLTNILKKRSPKSLFSRFLLIMIIPVLILQIVTMFIFYDKHWDSLSRNMTSSLAGEMDLIINGVSNVLKDERDFILQASKQYLELESYMEDDKKIGNNHNGEVRNHDIDDVNDEYKLLYKSLKHRLKNNIHISKHDEDRIKVEVQIEDDVLNILFSNKRISNPTTYIFVLWVIGTAIILLLVSVLLLKSQVRSVLKLTKAAEKFGKGQQIKDFKPTGAKEIRLAGIAFIEMKERIKRLLDTRTKMLAGVSHDLKTPLTRMLLMLSMLEDKEKAAELEKEVVDMEKMIEGYLKFAQLESEDHFVEPVIDIKLDEYIKEIVNKYRNEANKITIDIPNNITFKARPDYFSRCITNLLDNALKYSNYILIRAQLEDDKFVHLFIDDDGEGIPEEHLEDVFQPFFRVDKSRNHETGGVGLGLSITRDIIHKHGGEIKLSASHLGGLKINITLPM